MWVYKRRRPESRGVFEALCFVGFPLPAGGFALVFAVATVPLSVKETLFVPLVRVRIVGTVGGTKILPLFLGHLTGEEAVCDDIANFRIFLRHFVSPTWQDCQRRLAPAYYRGRCAMPYFLSVLIIPYRHQGGTQPFRATNANKTIHYL